LEQLVSANGYRQNMKVLYPIVAKAGERQSHDAKCAAFAELLQLDRLVCVVPVAEYRSARTAARNAVRLTDRGPIPSVEKKL
jgi:hypothetical protein